MSAASMAAGITLAQWFAGEAERVYALVAESDANAAVRRLVGLVLRHGGRITPRELQRLNGTAY